MVFNDFRGKSESKSFILLDSNGFWMLGGENYQRIQQQTCLENILCGILGFFGKFAMDYCAIFKLRPDF